jgi:hypothetical protein
MDTHPQPAIPSLCPARTSAVVWLVAFLAALIVYVSTADRGAQWQDSGWQQYRIATGSLDHPRGLVLVHPLQFWLGRAAVRTLWVEPAFATTLLSSLAAAIAVANLASTVFLLARSRSATLVAALAFMLSHTFWQHATHTESYTLTAALLTGEWLCLAAFSLGGNRNLLLLLALLNGLGIANHMLASIATPVDIIVILSAVRARRLSLPGAITAALLWVIGTSPYSTLVLGQIIETRDVLGTIGSALFGEFRGEVLNTRLGLRPLALALGYLVYNFPGLTIPLAILAMTRRDTRPLLFVRVLKWELLLYSVFVFRYAVVDQYTFFFPMYAILALFAGLGLAGLLERRLDGTGPSIAYRPPRGRLLLVAASVTAAWTPLVYLAAAHLSSSAGIFSNQVARKPYRNGYHALFLPWGIGQNYAERLNAQAFALAGDDGLILTTDSMVAIGLQYAEAVNNDHAGAILLPIEGSAAPDVVDRRRRLLRAYLSSGRPVVLVPRDRDKPVTCVPEARWRRDGDLYTLTELAPSSP